jgi:hypothetical protein
VNAREVLEFAFKAKVREDIEETKADGPPEVAGLVLADELADELLLFRWEAAERDCAVLYDGEYVYEKHIDDLSFDDTEEWSAFFYLVADALARSGEEHMFAMEVTRDIEALPDNGNPDQEGDE